MDSYLEHARENDNHALFESKLSPVWFYFPKPGECLSKANISCINAFLNLSHGTIKLILLLLCVVFLWKVYKDSRKR